ncbi:hypothetical protein ACLMAB_17165 [Brevibacillus laterosporus]
MVSGGIGKGKEHSEADVMKGYLIKKESLHPASTLKKGGKYVRKSQL